VDLWDLTKVLFRRWYIAVPMLLASIVGVLVLTQSAQPDYSATGYLQMIPPTNSNPDTTRPGFVRNPWTDLGIRALAQAAMIRVEDKAVMDDLVREGYTDSVILNIDDRSPLLSIEAVGNSPAQATGTVQELMKRLKGEIAQQQSQYGVATADTITTLVLDDGKNVTVVTTKVKRVIIVAVGIGMLLTAAITIGADALLVRRARRRLAASAPPRSMARPVLWPKGKPRVADPYPASTPVTPPAMDGPLVSAVTTPNGTNGDRPAPITYDSTLVVRVDTSKSGPAAATEDDSQQMGSDSTIVLPLSHSRWTRRDEDK
jgi:hypothetical protein